MGGHRAESEHPRGNWAGRDDNRPWGFWGHRAGGERTGGQRAKELALNFDYVSHPTLSVTTRDRYTITRTAVPAHRRDQAAASHMPADRERGGRR